jgi:hypothetical protein
MKKLLLTVLSGLMVTQVYAQKLETSFSIHTGLMHFAGPSSTPSIIIIAGTTNTPLYNSTNNPYGSKNGVGFGVDLQGQLVFKNRFIAGLQVGTELLKSKGDVNQVQTNFAPTVRQAEGFVNITNNYLNFNPYIGYRLPVPKMRLDVFAGAEFAYITNSDENGSAKAVNGNTYKINQDRKTVSVDNRLKFGVAAHYDRIGLIASYAHGLKNYLEPMMDGSSQKFGAHTEVMRLGVSLIIF